MEYALTVPGFETRPITLQTGGFFSGPKLLIDGSPAPKGPKRGTFILQRADGSQALAQLRSTNPVDPIPQVLIDGQKFKVAPALKWYAWVWAGLPLALALIGGLLGGLWGAVAMVVNGRVLRSDMKGVVKFLLAGAISLAAVAGFFISAAFFGLAMNGIFPPAPKEFRSEAGRFSVMAPVGLEEESQTLMTQAGIIEMHSFSGALEQAVIEVIYSDYPVGAIQGQSPDNVLDDNRDGVLENTQGTLISEKPIALDGHAGRELVFQSQTENGQKIVFRIHFYLVNDRLYQIMAIVKPGHETDAEIERFLSSFKLLEQ